MLIFVCSSQSKFFEPVEVNVEIYRDGKLLTPLQLEREYQDWILQMHERYDEETDSGEDQALARVKLFLLSTLQTKRHLEFRQMVGIKG